MRSFLNSTRNTVATWIAPKPEEDPLQRAQSLRALVAYYNSVGVYDRLAQFSSTLAQTGVLTSRQPDLEAFRNPARLVVEFHAGHMFTGLLPKALPIQTENPKIIPAIEQMWDWSNWSQRKQAFARWVGIREGIVKVIELEDGRPADQIIDPRTVIEHELNPRGHTIRIVIQYQVEFPKEDGTRETKVHTEEWTKDRYRTWLGDMAGNNLEALDGLQEDVPLSSFGIDFVPFVWAPFSELSPGIAVGAYEPHIEVIDNLAAAATRLDSMLFRYNRAIWGLEGTGLDQNQRPLSPPQIQGSFAQSMDPETGEDRLSPDGLARFERPQGMEIVKIHGDPFYRLPAGWSLKSLIANVDFRAALDILMSKHEWAQMVMPELLYYQTKDVANESGIAVRYKLAGAIDRNLEARGNAENAVVRLNQMKLTIAAKNNIVSGGINFSQLGSFENGDFEHTFEEREVMPESPMERATTFQVKLTNAQIMRELGYVEDEIAAYLGTEKLEPPEQPTNLTLPNQGAATTSATSGGTPGRTPQSVFDSIAGAGGREGGVPPGVPGQRQ